MISVIIVNYNAGEILTTCVKSVLASTAPVEVIISDNGSTDNSIEILQNNINDARMHIIKNNANLGFSKANNKVLPFAKGDTTLFLNPDCIINPNTLEHLNKVMESEKNVGMLTCVITDKDGTEQAGCRRTVPTPGKSLLRALGLSKLWPQLFKDFVLHYQPLPEKPTEVEAISGAFMFVNRNALEKVGVLDEGYFMHCEDLDWCMRFRQAGFRILFVPEISIIHLKGVCSKSRPLFVNWHMHKGMVRFYNKFFRQQYPKILLYLVIIAVWLRFSVISVISLLKYCFKRVRIHEA